MLSVNTDKFFNKVHVNQISLMRAIKSIGLVLKGTQLGTVFCIEAHDGKLYMRASGATNLECIVVTTEEIKDTFSVTCDYTDISSQLIGKSDVTMYISSEYVTIETEGLEASFRVNVADVPKIKRPDQELTDIKFISFYKALKYVTNVPALANIYKHYNLIEVHGSKVQMKYPNVWIECEGSGNIHTTISSDVAKVIVGFCEMDDSNLRVFISNNYISIIRSKEAMLTFPRNKVTDFVPVESLSKGMDYLGKIQFDGLVTKLKNLLRIVSKADAKIALYEKGVKVSVDTQDLKTTIEAGDTSTEMLGVFTTKLEFFVNLIPVMGSTIEVKKNGELVYFKGMFNSVLIASI